MKVGLLGPLEVLDDGGQPVAVPGGRQRTLLVLLALQAGRVVSADQLITGLWPTTSPREPTNALQLVVSKVRRAIGAESIETRPPGYVLLLPAEHVDALRFERLLRDGRSVPAEAPTTSALQYFDEALGLWRGEALAEFADVPKALAAAARLEELRAVTVEERFDALLSAGHDADLVPDLDAAISASPFRERLRGQLMLALYRCGRQADALRAFGDARNVLAEELGLDPGPELRRLEAAILRRDDELELPVPRRSPAPPVATREGTTPTNLRPALSSFVGRAADLVGLGELLDDHRFVTLVGAGGCGKTRLATEFALGRLEDFPGGVWFAPLDRLTNGAGVPGAVAEAVGLSSADSAGQPMLAVTGIVERLHDLLADRTALVVLDNCEHVIDDAARLAVDLLESSPGLRLVATSREGLRVPGEVVWRVPPLTTDDAVTLFTERARAVSSVELGERDRGVVAEVCARMDGMPLAIELTAAHTSAFTIGQLAERLDDRFRLLTSGARTALRRHQTLRAVTDWSYDLLFDDERKVFERLSIFVGGCTLEAAEAICADDELPGVEIGVLVGRLVDKSLVVRDGSGRFRLLFSLADYGRARLDERGDGDALRDRHAAYFAELAERSYVDWRRAGGHDQVWWLSCLTGELDNLRAALEWSVARGDGTTAQLLAGHLGWFWWNTGRGGEGHRWVERALACPGSPPLRVRGPAVTTAAWFALEAGDLDAAARHAASAITLSEQLGDRTSLGLALGVSAQLALLDGDIDQGAELLDRGRAVSELETDEWYQGAAAATGSWAATLRGQHEEAERAAVAAIDSFRSVGDICNLVWLLGTHGRRLQAGGRIDDAEVAVHEAHDVCVAFGLRGWQATMGAALGSLALERRDHDRAIELYDTVVDLARELALPAAEAIALDGLGVVYRRTGDHEAARRCHHAALAIADRLGRVVTMVSTADEESGAAYSLSQLGYVAEEVGDLDEARRRHVEALTLSTSHGNTAGVARALEGVAAVASATGDGELAATILGCAAQLRATVGSRLGGDELLDLERAVGRARDLLGDDAYAVAHEAGRSQDVEAVVAILEPTAHRQETDIGSRDHGRARQHAEPATTLDEGSQTRGDLGGL